MQQKITNYATSYVSDKTETEVSIDRLYVTFLGAAQIEGIYLEDKQKDTLLYAKSILVDVEWKPILDGFYHVKRVALEGVNANIHNSNDSTFNYQFLIDAFSDSTSNKKPATPDSTKEKSSIPFSIDKIYLADINASFKDITTTLKTSLSLTELETEVNSLDFDSLNFDVAHLNLNGVNFQYRQEQGHPSSEEESASGLPNIKVGSIKLSNIKFNYDAVYDSLFVGGDWNKLEITTASLNLNKQQINVEKLLNQQRSFSLLLPATDTTSAQSDSVNSNSDEPFTLPDWTIDVGEIDFNLQQLAINMGKPIETKSFDANHLNYSHINLSSESLSFSSKQIKADELRFSAQDKNNFNLKQLKTDLDFNDKGISLIGLKLQANQTNIDGDIILQYNSFDELIEADLNKINANIQFKAGTKVALNDAYYFSPSLKEVATYDSLTKHPIALYGQLKGNALKTDIEKLVVFYGENSSINTRGSVEKWMNADSIQVTLNDLTLDASTNDFSFFMPSDYPNHYPQKVELTGKGFYSPQKVSADANAVIDDYSQLDVKGFLNLTKKQDYKLDLKASKLALDKWLQDSVSFEPTDVFVNAEGSGFEWPNLTTDASIIIPKFSYQQMDFDSLFLDLQVRKDSLNLNSKYEDNKLAYQLTANGKLDSTQQKITLDLNLDKLNLQTFGIADSLAYAQLHLNSDILLIDSSQYIDLKIERMSYADQTNFFTFDPLKLKVGNDADSSYISLEWEQISGEVKLNQPLNALSRIQYNAENILALELFNVDSTYKPVDVKVDIKAALSENVNALLNESLTFDPLRFHGEYLSKKKMLDFQLNLPQLTYQDISIDSLAIDIKADTNSLKLENTIKKIESGFINIYETSLLADVNQEQANFKLFMLDELSDSLFFINATAKEYNDSLNWKINPDRLLLNGSRWEVNDDNTFKFTDNKLRIESLRLKQGEQSLAIETIENENSNGLAIDFSQFRIENFISLLNPEEIILKGMLDGKFRLADYNNPLDFTADINLKNISVFDKDGGNLSLSAKQIENHKYDLKIDAKGPLDLEGGGWIDTNTESPTFDIDLEMLKLSLPFVTAFSEGFIKEASGTIAGNFKIKGNIDNFDYSGDIRFKDASVFSTDLNTQFKLPNEKLLLKNQTIHLDNFTVLDEQNNKMQLTGDIYTNELLNPDIQLELKANNFQLMNTDKSNNETYYGKVYVDANISWKGTLNRPKINSELTINDNTSFTYVVPPSTVDIIEREGIVRFRSPYEALDSLKVKGDSTSKNVDISGIELDALIKTDKNAQFKVVVDERRGDYLIISGESDLNLGLNEAGTINLTGNYLVNEGYYQLSLYDLVKRKFEIQSGSQVKWYGDPYEAGLDITANYQVETSPSTLMADPSSSSQTKSQYRQKVPFIVNLFINGSLSSPEITFGLNMPQDVRGTFGGQVYQQIQSINNNEAELNKQVFSLLVLNQFFPRGSSGTGPDSEVIARNSASQILTNQLNKISDQYIKGIDLSLDLDSYKDYESGTAQDRTQLGLSLSKSLFNNRFRVQIGSQVDLEGQQRQDQSATDILGNVLIEYLLTEDGTYKLTGYRKNEFEGLIEGQVTVTGLSVQFNKEFEQFKDLWNNSDEE